MDLRTIPWVISFLYGGFHVGIIVTALMFIFRFFIGGIGMYAAFIAYTISTLILLYYFRNYLHFPYKKKVRSTISLTLITSLLVVSSMQVIFRFSISDVIIFYLFFIALHLITMWFIIYLIEIYKQNEELQLELHRSEKLRVVGQMAASVAHEIRNPMTTVQGFLQLLSQEDSTPKKHKQYMQMMQLELKRAEMIISDYLTLAKPEAERVETIDLKNLVQRINHTLSPFATMHGVSIDFIVLHDDDFWIEGSSDKIQQVFINIFKNAIEASSKNDIIYVSIFRQNKMVHVSIQDTGVGMTKEEINSLGAPFYSLKENGTGLGLTVCYSIVDSMGGTIKVESEKNVGTTFIISLPEYRK